MTTSAYTILVVDGYTATRTATLDLLRSAGYSAMGSATVEAALGLLAIFPFDVVVVTLPARKRDHSVSVLDQVRGKYPEVSTITVTHPINSPEFLTKVAQSVTVGRNIRRWPRKSVFGGLNARIGDYAATVVNISYGGLRLEVEEPLPAISGSVLTVELPPFGLKIQARPIWSTEFADAGSWRCGAELAESNEARVRVWRALVDLLPHSDVPGRTGGSGSRYRFR